MNTVEFTKFQQYQAAADRYRIRQDALRKDGMYVLTLKNHRRYFQNESPVNTIAEFLKISDPNVIADAKAIPNKNCIKDCTIIYLFKFLNLTFAHIAMTRRVELLKRMGSFNVQLAFPDRMSVGKLKYLKENGVIAGFGQNRLGYIYVALYVKDGKKNEKEYVVLNAPEFDTNLTTAEDFRKLKSKNDIFVHLDANTGKHTVVKLNSTTSQLYHEKLNNQINTNFMPIHNLMLHMNNEQAARDHQNYVNSIGFSSDQSSEGINRNLELNDVEQDYVDHDVFNDDENNEIRVKKSEREDKNSSSATNNKNFKSAFPHSNIGNQTEIQNRQNQINHSNTKNMQMPINYSYPMFYPHQRFIPGLHNGIPIGIPPWQLQHNPMQNNLFHDPNQVMYSHPNHPGHHPHMIQQTQPLYYLPNFGNYNHFQMHHHPHGFYNGQFNNLQSQFGQNNGFNESSFNTNVKSTNTNIRMEKSNNLNNNNRKSNRKPSNSSTYSDNSSSKCVFEDFNNENPKEQKDKCIFQNDNPSQRSSSLWNTNYTETRNSSIVNTPVAMKAFLSPTAENTPKIQNLKLSDLNTPTNNPIRKEYQMVKPVIISGMQDLTVLQKDVHISNNSNLSENSAISITSSKNSGIFQQKYDKNERCDSGIDPFSAIQATNFSKNLINLRDEKIIYNSESNFSQDSNNESNSEVIHSSVLETPVLPSYQNRFKVDSNISNFNLNNYSMNSTSNNSNFNRVVRENNHNGQFSSKIPMAREVGLGRF